MSILAHIMISMRPIRRNAFCAALAPQALAQLPSARIPLLAKMPCAACRNSSGA
jgi:hypothetical protein